MCSSDLPESEIFKRAVEATPGARIEDEHLVMPMIRQQRTEQALEPSTRGGVFYLPEGSKDIKYFKGNEDLYGGTQSISGETAFSNPLFVKGSVGGKAPEVAFEALHGKGAMKKLDDDIFQVVNENWLRKKDPELYYERVADLLKSYGVDHADPGLAEYIVDRKSTRLNSSH